MTRAELCAEWQRRKAEALETGATAPVAKLANVILDQLERLDGHDGTARLMTTADAATVLRVSKKTIRGWCGKGRFPGATKTSGRSGDWRIPSSDVYTLAGAEPKRKPQLLRTC